MKRGISDGTNPTAPVTREQLAAMLYRFAGAPAVSGALNFNSANAVSEYARSALLWATQNGILNGVGGDLAAPAAPAERSGRDDAGALPAKRRLKPNPSRQREYVYAKAQIGAVLSSDLCFCLLFVDGTI